MRREIHALSPRRAAARARAAMNSASSESTPCSRGSVRGSPSSRMRAVREEQHAVADVLDLVHVVRRPEDAAVAALRRCRGSRGEGPARSPDRARRSARRAAAASARSASPWRATRASARRTRARRIWCRESAGDRSGRASPRCARARRARRRAARTSVRFCTTVRLPGSGA